MAAELNVTDRPWVARHLIKPEAMVSSPRRRPLVYIYDLPAEFNTRMHQYRLDKVNHHPMQSIIGRALQALHACPRRRPDLQSSQERIVNCCLKCLVIALQRTCTWRLFSQYGNISYMNSWTYAIEMAFHEALLQASPHSSQLPVVTYTLSTWQAG